MKLAALPRMCIAAYLYAWLGSWYVGQRRLGSVSERSGTLKMGFVVKCACSIRVTAWA